VVTGWRDVDAQDCCLRLVWLGAPVGGVYGAHGDLCQDQLEGANAELAKLVSMFVSLVALAGFVQAHATVPTSIH